jgi:uncharacterized membrane protein YgcG
MKALVHFGILLVMAISVPTRGAEVGEPARGVPQETVTISGLIGLPGVTLEGLPGRPVTDRSGRYSVRVPVGWSGTVTPISVEAAEQGFGFEPPSRTYDRIESDLPNMDYRLARTRVPPVPPLLSKGLEVLLIPTSEVDPEQFRETREDVQIMLNILREKLSEPRTILGVLYDYGDFFGGPEDDAQAFHLQDYGVLFVVKMDFPFSQAMPATNPGASNGRTDADPVWRRARQRLYAPRDMRRHRQGGVPAAPDPMSFEQLQEDLIQTLRHATNIRHLDPNDRVVVTIVARDQEPVPVSESPSGGSFSTGFGGWFQGSSYSMSGGSFGPGGGSTYSNSRASARGSAQAGQAPRRTPRRQTTSAARPAAPTTVLTIQAGKADVDAFAQGTIGFEAFQQRVKVFSY